MPTSTQVIADMQSEIISEKWTSMSSGNIPQSKEYDLWVRFGGSQEQLSICRGTYKECMHAADIMYRFIVQQGKVHKPMYAFNRHAVTPDRIVVGCIRTAGAYNGAYNKPGLWATFIIEEVQDGK